MHSRSVTAYSSRKTIISAGSGSHRLASLAVADLAFARQNYMLPSHKFRNTTSAATKSETKLTLAFDHVLWLAALWSSNASRAYSPTSRNDPLLALERTDIGQSRDQSFSYTGTSCVG